MSRFLESIKIVNGKAPLLSYHQDRLNQTMSRFYPGAKKINLSEIVNTVDKCDKVIKLRVIYNAQVQKKELLDYNQKIISRFHLIKSNDISYNFKYSDRTIFKDLKSKIPKNDEIIIVKGNKITDSSYSNLAFKKDNIWYTPDSPLLNGCQRKHLLSTKKLICKSINPYDLNSFDHFCLINSMLDIFSSEKYPINLISKDFFQ